MDLSTFPLGPLHTNCYLLSQNGEAVLIDPGGSPDCLLTHLKKARLTLTQILITHLHFDHTYGVRALAEATGAPVLASEADRPTLATEVGRGGFMGMPQVEPYEFTPIEPGEYRFLDQPCTVLATPGHSPGSLSYYFPKAAMCFVGDAIFYRSVGRTDFPGGDQDALLRSVRERILTLPPNTVLYSGHGPETTVDAECHHNPFFAGAAL